MRSVTRRAAAIALGVVAAAVLVVIATPRIPAVWGPVWGVGDIATGGIEERHERLVNHPFPTTLAPPGVQVWFAGPR